MKKTKRRYTMTRRAETAAATRQRILDSAVQLYCDRQIEEFTLDEVARRAGATVQTVLRAFGSKENLLLAALHRLAEGGVPLKPTPPGDVAAAVGAIFDLYELMGDLLMQRLTDERRLPALEPMLEKGRDNHRGLVEDPVRAPAQVPAAAQRAQILHPLTVATDVYVWEKLRRDHALSCRAAEAIVRRMILSGEKGGRRWQIFG